MLSLSRRGRSTASRLHWRKEKEQIQLSSSHYTTAFRRQRSVETFAQWPQSARTFSSCHEMMAFCDTGERRGQSLSVGVTPDVRVKGSLHSFTSAHCRIDSQRQRSYFSSNQDAALHSSLRSGLLHTNGIVPDSRYAYLGHDRRPLVFFSSQTQQEDEKSQAPDRPKPSPRLGTTKIPTPPSGPIEANPIMELSKTSTKSIVRKGTDAVFSVLKTVLTFLFQIPGNLFYYITHPKERRERIAGLKQAAKDEAHHYWMGTKLLWGDVLTARTLVGRILQGSTLTRRERKQLLRTVTDLFRLVPFSMFLLIPFMEFALPFALRIFPNMLPSTYQDSLKTEENMKRELQTRIAMTQFFQETLEKLAEEQKRKASKKKQELVDWGTSDETVEKQEDSAGTLLEFLEKARNGEPVPPDIIIRYANYFHDDMTLDNMPRMQLVNLCKYMSMSHYGSEAFLRFQLRHRIRVLREDDQRILWESIDSLTKMELREACRERGMRSTGLGKDAYKRALQEWLDLSVNKNVPIALLIMSRTFFLREDSFDRKPDEDTGNKSLDHLVDAISGLDKEVVNEVILDVATDQEKASDPEIRKIKLEVLTQQNELIRQEKLDRESAAKRRENSEKEEPETFAPEAQLETEQVEVIKVSDAATEESTTETVDTPPPDKEPDQEEEYELSAEEMEAISHLVSDDPVSKERAELERLKAAIKGEEKDDDDEAVSDDVVEVTATQELPDLATEVDFKEITEKETVFVDDVSVARPDEAPLDQTEAESAPEEATKDPVVDRLKKKVESMVDKIEVQLSDAEIKIGDKLHFLDKDRDGILTREEMAEVLQQVLRREISFDEAMEIATEMDDNHDGIFTVEELVRWIDEHKLVKFVEAGRDADMDRIMENQSMDPQASDSKSDTTK